MSAPTLGALRGNTTPYVVEARGACTLHFSGSAIQSRMQLDAPEALDLAYTRTMMAFLLFVPEPRRIAMVGLGGGSMAKFCHRHLPQAHTVVVEISPEVIALRERFQVPPDSARFEVVLGDGARFVRAASGTFDVLLVDGFDSEGMPEGLATQRFYDDCRAALAPGGMLSVNLHLEDVRHAVLVDRLRRSFDGQVLVVDDGEGGNSIVLAANGPALARYRPGIVRPPPGLEGAAAAALLADFGLVVAALVAQRRQQATERR